MWDVLKYTDMCLSKQQESWERRTERICVTGPLFYTQGGGEIKGGWRKKNRSCISELGGGKNKDWKKCLKRGGVRPTKGGKRVGNPQGFRILSEKTKRIGPGELELGKRLGVYSKVRKEGPGECGS